MKFLQWSDLHLEFHKPGPGYEFPRPTPECPAGSIDAILIAGDLHTGDSHVNALLEIEEEWGVPVISIRGNHEFYHGEYHEVIARQDALVEEARRRGRNIRILDRDSVVLGGVRILGCTLWTDGTIAGLSQRDAAFGLKWVMNDYKKVLFATGGEAEAGLMEPDHTMAIHAQDRRWLLGELAKPFGGSTLVMTHHLPAPELFTDKKAEYAEGYGSDMRAEILGQKIDAWVTGHTHDARRGLIMGLHGSIAFTSNMAGYPGQRTNFDPYRVLDMDNPTAGLAPLEICAKRLSMAPPATDVLARLSAGAAGDFSM